MAKRPKTVKRRCFEDVFSAGIWLASAPLHEAGRTRKSASTLKAKQGIGQLDFVSDNSDALFNAYLQILSSSKPHSEVASTTHVPVLKGDTKRRFAVFWFLQAGRSPSKCSVYKRSGRGAFPAKENPSPASRNIQPAENLRQKIKSSWLAEFYHK